MTGKFEPGHKFDPADNRAKNKLFQGENFERAQQALEKLRPIADRHNCTLAQLALAWLIAQPQTNAFTKGVGNAIAGARYPEQAAANALAAEVKLSAAELTEIDAIGRIVTDHFDDSPIMWNW